MQGNERAELERQYHELYATYGKPLEPSIGVNSLLYRRGDTLLGKSLDEVSYEGVERFGRGIFVYRVGERAALKWR